MKVFKFGGASIRDVERIKNVGNIVSDYPNQKLLLIVSALGKITNALEGVLLDYFAENKNPNHSLDLIKHTHLDIVNELFGQNIEFNDELSDVFVEIEWQLEDEQEDNFDFAYDQIVSVGELASSKIINTYLKSIGLKSVWLDARDVIQTDNNYREANVDWVKSCELINSNLSGLFEKADVVVTQGFIGSSSENYTTTLGREGSDFSAAIFAHCLNAEEVYIWKDVPGILTADPRLFKNQKKIDKLSYREAIEMSYYGAKVIHPKTIKPLQNKGIPLHVKSFINPKEEGTIIYHEEVIDYPPIIVFEHHQTLIRIATIDFSFIAEKHMSLIFNLINEHRVKVKLMKNTAISFLLSVDTNKERIDALIKDLQNQFKITLEDDLELITIRHYNDEIINKLTKGRTILFQERVPNTVQLVVNVKKDN